MRLLSILFGLVFIAWTANNLHSNPRWTWSPGEGEVPRDVVALYMNTAYKEGNLEKAAKDFLTPKTKDSVPADKIFPLGKPFEPKVKQVIAEGFNVAVIYTIDGDPTKSQYVEIFNIRGGRLATRERIVQPGSVAATSQAAPAPAAAAANN